MNTLIQSCDSCEHWDGDCFCSLPAKDRLISGHIVEAESVVCAKWEKRDDMQARDEEKSFRAGARGGRDYELRLRIS
jgi:hypothetical protein